MLSLLLAHAGDHLNPGDWVDRDGESGGKTDAIIAASVFGFALIVGWLDRWLRGR